MLHLWLRYTQALITQMAQTAVCNRQHPVEQQLCRWLVLSLDRLSTDLGVRRGGVTEAAGELQRAGLIRYRRGHIEVLDRPALEQVLCGCYAVLKPQFDRMLAEIPPGDPFHVFGQSAP